MELTHFNKSGRAHMVDVTEKSATVREATAAGRVTMQAGTFTRIVEGTVGKGDVLAVAQVAGVMAAKKTSELIPMCHPLFLSSVAIEFELDEANHAVIIQATVKTTGTTGVEMEALTAVSVAGLTIYDMCKSIDRGMTIEEVRLLAKSGGKSGIYSRRDGNDVR